MAHFAELNDSNVVQRVIVVGNSDCLDGDNNESEAVGIQFCKSLYGEATNWKQTSYNYNIRKNYAGEGFTYDESRNAFIPPKTFPSSVLNEDTCLWKAPIDYPDATKRYEWDEDLYQSDNTKGWVLDAPIPETGPIITE